LSIFHSNIRSLRKKLCYIIDVIEDFSDIIDVIEEYFDIIDMFFSGTSDVPSGPG
jgi:hypothetical protein